MDEIEICKVTETVKKAKKSKDENLNEKKTTLNHKNRDIEYFLCFGFSTYGESAFACNFYKKQRKLKRKSISLFSVNQMHNSMAPRI